MTLSASLKNCQAPRSSVTMPPKESARRTIASEKLGRQSDGAATLRARVVVAVDTRRPHTSAQTPQPVKASASVVRPPSQFAPRLIRDWLRKSSPCSRRARGSVSKTSSRNCSDSTRRIGTRIGSLKNAATSGAVVIRIRAQSRFTAITTPNTWRRNSSPGASRWTRTTSRPRSFRR